MKKIEEKVDVKKMIKDMGKDFGGSNEDQGRIIIKGCKV